MQLGVRESSHQVPVAGVTTDQLVKRIGDCEARAYALGSCACGNGYFCGIWTSKVSVLFSPPLDLNVPPAPSAARWIEVAEADGRTMGAEPAQLNPSGITVELEVQVLAARRPRL